MKRKFCGVALALGMLMQTVAAAVELSVAATLRDTDGRINGAQLTLQGLSDRVYALYTDYKSLILRTGRPQEATFVHWDGMASRHPVPSRIF